MPSGGSAGGGNEQINKEIIQAALSLSRKKTGRWDQAPADVCPQKVALAAMSTIRGRLMESTVLVENLYRFKSKSISFQHAGRS